MHPWRNTIPRTYLLRATPAARTSLDKLNRLTKQRQNDQGWASATISALVVLVVLMFLGSVAHDAVGALWGHTAGMWAFGIACALSPIGFGIYAAYRFGYWVARRWRQATETKLRKHHAVVPVNSLLIDVWWSTCDRLGISRDANPAQPEHYGEFFQTLQYQVTEAYAANEVLGNKLFAQIERTIADCLTPLADSLRYIEAADRTFSTCLENGQQAQKDVPAATLVHDA